MFELLTNPCCTPESLTCVYCAKTGKRQQPVMTGFHAASQLSDALHLHVGQLVLQSAVLSGVGKIRGREIKNKADSST